MWFFIRMTWQRLTRWDHISNSDVWGMNSIFIKKMYPYVRHFVTAKWRHGYHLLPQFWNKDDLNDYDHDVAIKAWEDVLKEILFAFEFYYMDEWGSTSIGKRLEAKMKRLYGDWEKKALDHCSVWDEGEILGSMIHDYNNITPAQSDALEKKYGKNWLSKVHTFYYDHDLYWKLAERADKGMKLFGEYAMGMWD